MIRFILLALCFIVTGCGMKTLDPVTHDLPDGSTLEVRGQWAETFSLGYVGQETYKCDEGYNVVKATKVDGEVRYEVMCEQISSYHHADRGILRGTMENTAPAIAGGWFYMKGQEKRRPDQTNVSNVNEGGNATGGDAYAEGGKGGQGGAGGAGGSGGSVSVVNAVNNSLNQSQGQLQGQTQGQASHNNNINVNKPTAISAPHINNHNININKPKASANANATATVNNGMMGGGGGCMGRNCGD